MTYWKKKKIVAKLSNVKSCCLPPIVDTHRSIIKHRLNMVHDHQDGLGFVRGTTRKIIDFVLELVSSVITH